MKNRLVLLSLGLIIAGCTSPQSPAPYELKGSKFYGKNNPVEENNDISSTEDEEESDFVYKGKVGESNSSRSLDEDTIDFTEEDTPSPRQSYRQGSSTKTDEPEVIKSSRLAPPEHIDAYEEKYDSGQVKVPSFNQKPVKDSAASTSEYLDLSPVEKKASKSIQSNLAPANQEQPKSYAANISDKLKNVSPKEKPSFAEEAKVENEESQVAAVATPKEKPAEKPVKIAAIPQPKSKPASLNQVAPASGDDSEEEKTSFLNIPQKPAPIKVDERKIEEPKKVEAPKKIELTSIKEEIQADIRKTDITSIPKMESPAPAAPASASKFIKPVEGKIIQEFGAGNDGIKIQAAEGTPVKAAAGGEIVYSGNQLQGYGNMLVIRHSNGYLTAYSHLEDLSLKKGAKVAQGEVIGKVGKSGNVSSPQLHFGVRKGRSAVNPRDYL